MNYIVAQLNIPGQSLNGSTGDVDQTSGLAIDSLSSDDRVSLEGRWDFGQSGVDGCWTGQTLTAKPEVLGSDSDTARVWKSLKGSQSEQATLAIARSLEHLVGEQVGINEELVQIQESSERWEEILQDWLTRPKLHQMQWSCLCRGTFPEGLGNGETRRSRRSWLLLPVTPMNHWW